MKKEIKLIQRADEPGAAYVELHDHPHVWTEGVLCKSSVSLDSLIENYSGPRLTLDFNADGVPVGLEILYFDDFDEDE